MTRLFRPAALATAGLLLALGFAGSAGVASAATHSGAVTLVPGGPMFRAQTSGNEPFPVTSLNWSGYAATAGKGQTFDAVQGSFVQPKITCSGKFTITSNWVGLDGFNDQTVEQDGTFASCTGPNHMTPVYKAWIEMFPAPTKLVFPVSPGDYIDTSVTYSSGAFHLSIEDTTTGKRHMTTATCTTCARASAEWIIERPASCNSTGTKCQIDRLADFHTTAMDNSYAQLTGGSLKTPGQFFTNYPIDMISVVKPGFISTDQVSAVSGPSFSVLFNRSGTPFKITL